MGFFNDRQKQKMQQSQLEAETHARKAAMAAEQHTDSWLIKIADSKWSWAIVLGIIVTAWLIGVLL